MRDYSDKLKTLANVFLANRVKFGVMVSDVLLIKPKIVTEAAFVATNEGELIRVLDTASELKIPCLVLGSGLKHKFRQTISGLLVADKTRLLKIVGIKGKVGGAGIGVDEASVEVASGENLLRLNEFLRQHGLAEVDVVDDPNITIGERLEWDDSLRSLVEKIKIWDQGQVYRCNIFELNKARHVILGVIIKTKAK